MKVAKRNVAREIIADLKQMHATLAAGKPLAQRYTVRSHGRVPAPGDYDAAAVRRTRDLLGVSQPVFAQLLGVSPALVRSWEGGQRVPAPIARRLLDAIAARPADWRAMVPAA